jgi:NAD(P)-dependent dehydrogenase (short-subunit alcohol dehydrogenase family)
VSNALSRDTSRQIDILANNAAVPTLAELNKPLEAISAGDLAHVYDLNVRAPIPLTKAVLSHLPTFPLSAPELGSPISQCVVRVKAALEELD